MGIAIPPLEMRRLVGPVEPDEFDNPGGVPIFRQFGFPESTYQAVFDFGCGCGRLARQLLQQSPRPQRYVGIDPNRNMVEWCVAELGPHDANFKFLHHDVYSPGYADHNTLQLSQPFPVGDGEFSLLIANSVFTHLAQSQTQYYLGELARVLANDGVAFTTWFLFDNDSFPFLEEGPFCLYTSATYFSQAVIYDRRWLLRTLQRLGLRVRLTSPPAIPGHQWILLIERRTSEADDAFPLGVEAADRLCGATALPKAPGGGVTNAVPKGRQGMSTSDWVDRMPVPPPPPAPAGSLAELAELRQRQLARMSRLRRLLRKVLR